MQVFGQSISHLVKGFLERYTQMPGDEKVMEKNKFHLFL
tara:strand:+ start:522 stop:638 length:117 start_codon:yes stop_codon:yes gene_type:complete